MAETKIPEMDRLTGQLYHLAGIIGKLGISVANGQKALNADYMHNLEKLLDMIKKLLGKDTNENQITVLKELLTQLAPSRYQFTKTTLEFSADLSERKAEELQGALGLGFGGVMISAGYARAFAYDYRAAARITTVLDALPMDEEFGQTLQENAKGLGDLTLPAATKLEEDIFKSLEAIKAALPAPAAGG